MLTMPFMADPLEKLLRGEKWQTRRRVKANVPDYVHGLTCFLADPRLWVDVDGLPFEVQAPLIAGNTVGVLEPWGPDGDPNAMPVEEIRYWLHIERVRVEALQSISDDGAQAEGYPNAKAFLAGPWASKTIAKYGNPLVWVYDVRLLPDSPIKRIQYRAQAMFPQVELWLSKELEGFAIDRLIVPGRERRQGIGSRVLTFLLAEADKHGMPVFLTAQGNPEWGTTSNRRLAHFYRRFGFVPNKGPNKEWRTNYTMVRPAQRDR